MTHIQFITHENDRFSYIEGAELALCGGCKWVQLRMKNATDEEFISVGHKILHLCRSHQATFIVDDRVHLVNELGADGVHLGKNDMPVDKARAMLGKEKIIGGTANTFADIQKLAAHGVDYIGCGPFRYTTTKQNLAPLLGLKGYETLLKQMEESQIHIPLIAIGGIMRDDIPDLIKIGVDGIAISGAILNAENPKEEMEKLINI